MQCKFQLLFHIQMKDGEGAASSLNALMFEKAELEKIVYTVVCSIVFDLKLVSTFIFLISIRRNILKNSNKYFNALFYFYMFKFTVIFLFFSAGFNDG